MGGEIRTCSSCCLRDVKVMKTVKQSSTNQNSCKSLREALTMMIRRAILGKVHGRGVKGTGSR